MLIGICEDDPFFRQELRCKIEAQPQDLVPVQIMEFDSGEAMQESGAPFDLVFLDIELQGQQSGLTLAHALLETRPEVILVFISSHTEYISTALHLPTFQFLLKPVSDALFAEEFARCIDRYRSDHAVMTIGQGAKQQDLAVKDILYITTNKRKMQIYDQYGHIYECYGKLSDWEDFLLMHHFVRVHKSYCVNCHYIKKLQGIAVLLYDPQKKELLSLPVSRRYKEHAQMVYQNYILGVKDK